ncbi:uncharacterized protein LOC131232536 [Magnolia sinica]|uniref:uncharacterized protein LOC131232536 n=1 Tax=Magnolia sinica TaxID=86752 RepID=UPI0026588003|nr:uncharacterized protein LOC131232536 [Magnolia sinica]
MGCKINTSNSPILFKLSTRTPTTIPSSIPVQPKRPKTHSITYSSSSNKGPIPQRPTTTATTQNQQLKTVLYNVKFQTLRSCKLGISRYPDFDYNAEGGTGTAAGTKNTAIVSDKISISFDAQTLYIPPLTDSTTRFLGLPLPPFLKIDILPELFQGTIDEETGQVDLEFRAKFLFSVGSIYRAPPLLVSTVLTSEESRGKIKGGRGERLDGEGKCRLVGVATVDPISDLLMDSFLGLPTECLADLNAIISISTST